MQYTKLRTYFSLVTKFQVTGAAPNLRIKDVIMCCLVRLLYISVTDEY
jgi:hypothetical protein